MPYLYKCIEYLFATINKIVEFELKWITNAGDLNWIKSPNHLNILKPSCRIMNLQYCWFLMKMASFKFILFILIYCLNDAIYGGNVRWNHSVVQCASHWLFPLPVKASYWCPTYLILDTSWTICLVSVARTTDSP